MTRKTCPDRLHVDVSLKSVCHELLLDLSLPEVCKTLDLLFDDNGMRPMTRSTMPRTRARAVMETTRLRRRRAATYVTNYLETSSCDEYSNPLTPMRELRSSVRVKVEPELSVWDSGRPKRTCIAKKRGSADERLMFDNRNYYKVEVLSNKLRSVRKVKSPPISEDSEDDKVYSFPKKKRQSSAITRLNNEAENFLFPHRSDSSSDETDTTDPPPRSPQRRKETNENARPKVIKMEAEDSNSSESSVLKKRRRLTQAEAFILDNQRYYKFETPGSRLRYQGSYLSPVTTKNNGDFGIKHSRHKEKELHQPKSELKLDELQFAFETVPNTEPWYTTFQRQDKGQECYTCYNYIAGYKPFLLPYEMGPLPSLNPRVCFYAYKQMKKEILGDTEPSVSEACSTPDVDTIKTDYASSTGEETKSSEDVSAQRVYRKTKRRKVLSSKNPRKSPRQHASTLAILSSLIHQRKRREHKCRDETKRLSAIAEEEKEADYDVLSKSIDDMLSNSYDDMNLMERLAGDDAIDVRCKSNAVECLDDYMRGETVEVRKTKDNLANVVVRKPARKKKKNRTGWPNKNKRPTFRKEGSDSRDSIKHSGPETGSDCKPKQLNGEVRVTKFNGELCFKNVGVPRRKERRQSSSENCVEVVIPSAGDKIDCVNVDLAKWENAEKLLAAKIRYENDVLFQPIVRVQKLDSNNIETKCTEKQFSVSSPKQNRKSRRMPASPKSPRMLRRPRGRWY